MIQTLQNIIVTDTDIEKVFFVLNANNEAHKLTASFLAANLGNYVFFATELHNKTFSNILIEFPQMLIKIAIFLY